MALSLPRLLRKSLRIVFGVHHYHLGEFPESQIPDFAVARSSKTHPFQKKKSIGANRQPLGLIAMLGLALPMRSGLECNFAVEVAKAGENGRGGLLAGQAF